MRRLFLFTIIIILFINSVLAAMPPQWKECRQRGYKIEENQERGGWDCVFPNGDRCELSDFNIGTCGSEYMIEDYCIEEGNPVWDKDKCCPGTRPYLPLGIMGQAHCSSSYKSYFYPYSHLIYYLIFRNPAFWIIGAIIIGFLIYWLIKRRRRNSIEQH